MRLILAAVIVLVHLAFCVSSSQAECAGDCTTVDPVANVPINIDTSSAVHLWLEGGVAWKFWARGRSLHAPDCGGIYSDVLVAGGWISGDVFSVPIGGDPVDLPASLSGNRLLNFFFVEFGSGELGDNSGSTTVYYQRADGGAIRSVVVDPRTNVVMNMNGSNAAVMSLDPTEHYTFCATGASQYAGTGGYYGAAFLCAQWGDESVLKAIPIDTAETIFLSAGASGPVYLWFPEFGSGYLGDNHGGTQVCATPLVGETSSANSGGPADRTGGVAIARIWPNPSDGAVTVELAPSLVGRPAVNLGIFDSSGRLVQSLTPTGAARNGAGPSESLAWDGCWADGRRVPAGAYFVRLNTEDGGVSGERVVILR